MVVCVAETLHKNVGPEFKHSCSSPFLLLVLLSSCECSQNSPHSDTSSHTYLHNLTLFSSYTITLSNTLPLLTPLHGPNAKQVYSCNVTPFGNLQGGQRGPIPKVTWCQVLLVQCTPLLHHNITSPLHIKNISLSCLECTTPTGARTVPRSNVAPENGNEHVLRIFIGCCHGTYCLVFPCYLGTSISCCHGCYGTSFAVQAYTSSSVSASVDVWAFGFIAIKVFLGRNVEEQRRDVRVLGLCDTQ